MPKSTPAFTFSQWRAIALTLEDMRGWATLAAHVQFYDTDTGVQLDEPVTAIGDYDRTPRRGLPEKWQELFVAQGWVAPVRHGGSWAWRPTEAGHAVRRRWLPAHLATDT